MVGFVSAAGLFIGISQLPQIFGVPLHGEFHRNYMLFQWFAEHNPIANGNKYVRGGGGVCVCGLWIGLDPEPFNH